MVLVRMKNKQNLSILAGVCSAFVLVRIATGCPQQTPRDCRQAYENGCRQDGVYIIDPGCAEPFKVYCDMKNGGWTVFQRRMDGSLSFDEEWTKYGSGFGLENLKGEHWLGLDRIHCLTSSAPRTELWVDLANFEGNYKYAHYSFFYVDNRGTNYTLHINGYSGTAGDSMAGDHSLNGMMFSTSDRDNDIRASNLESCVSERSGAWWHRDCGHSSLNGHYYRGGVVNFRGVKWSTFRGDYSLKYTQMKLRSR